MPLNVTLRPRINEYPIWERPQLIERLAEVELQLVTILQDYYRMQADETRSKSESWLDSPEQTIAGKQRDVDLATYHVTASILEVRGELESLKEERTFILFLLGDK